MNYKITALAENTTYRHNVLAQHGQSILIEVADYKLLFDVGEIDGAITHNLKQLNISISDLNDIVISHRHIDHIGALKSMLPDLINQNLYLPLQLGEPELKNPAEKYSFLKPIPDGHYNLAINKEDSIEINQYNKVKVVTDVGFEIANGIFTTGCIGDWMQEQAIIIDQKEMGLTLIVACSHPTVEKLLIKAEEVTGNKKVRGIIGGMHYTDFSENEIREKAEYLKSLNLEFIVPSHCTTVLGGKILKEVLGGIVKLSKTGSFGAGNSVSIGENVSTNFVS